MNEVMQTMGERADANVPLIEAMARAGYEFLRDVDWDPPWEELSEKAKGTEREMAGVYLDVVRERCRGRENWSNPMDSRIIGLPTSFERVEPSPGECR